MFILFAFLGVQLAVRQDHEHFRELTDRREFGEANPVGVPREEKQQRFSPLLFNEFSET